MRITEVHITGEAQNFAVIKRKAGSDSIEVEVITPTGNNTVRVSANDDKGLWEAAQRLQRQLDGFRGCGGDVRPYLGVLQSLSDL
ncbi:MAG TPA: hypothetical protein VEB22_14660 [Phycisphaerales bacterium]|nr:hypothetical protein [Phycisphaerales bacterium]